MTKAGLSDAEIIVVDNGSTDNTYLVLRDWQSANLIRMQLLYEPRPGLSRARNCALKVARGKLLAFTDDDCRFTEDYINQLIEYDRYDTGIVLRFGNVALGDRTDLPLTITQPKLKRFSLRQKSAYSENIGDSGLGCNMTMRRILVEKIGFFDEDMGAGTSINAGEDIDYVFRAYIAGAVIETVPDMIVLHYHGRKTSAEGYRLLRGYMIGSGALYAKYLFRHPALCRPFYWDLKAAIIETTTRTNSFLPIVGFSHRHKVYYSLIGSVQYFHHKMRLTKLW